MKFFWSRFVCRTCNSFSFAPFKRCGSRNCRGFILLLKKIKHKIYLTRTNALHQKCSYVLYNLIVCKKAQATVEAAFMIPVIFLLLLLLLQPGIILYDFIVMNSAASETCRVLSTSNLNDKEKICEAFLRRRLSAIPQQDNFHVHSQGCTYEIVLEGDQCSNFNSVTIKNQLKPLPLIGFFSEILGILNKNKCFEIQCSSKQAIKPKWTENSPQTSNPENWVGAWLKS